jgi:hypothetical protein
VTREEVDSLGRSPADVVMAYLADRRAFEIEAIALAELADKSDDPTPYEREIDAKWRRFVLTYVSLDAVREGHVVQGYARPPEVDPSKTTISAVRRRADAIIAVTYETAHPHQRGVFDYRLRMFDGEWRLEDRRSRGEDGRWIRYLL